MITTCRSCGAPILFKRTSAGKLMPLDRDPTPDGNVMLGFVGGEETAILLTDPGDIAGCAVDGVPLFMPHFATCPDADRFRKAS